MQRGVFIAARLAIAASFVLGLTALRADAAFTYVDLGPSYHISGDEFRSECFQDSYSSCQNV